MKIIITPKTPNGEVGLKSYISDNLELTDLVKGLGSIRNVRKINVILKKWKINYAQYVGSKRIVEKYSNLDGTLDPVVLTIELYDGQTDRLTRDKYVRDLNKVLNKCYNVYDGDLNFEEVSDG